MTAAALLALAAAALAFVIVGLAGLLIRRRAYLRITFELERTHRRDDRPDPPDPPPED